jgi:hypothetical protein
MNTSAIHSPCGYSKHERRLDSMGDSSKIHAVRITLTHDKIETAYNNASTGNSEPNIIWTTIKGYEYLKEKFRPRMPIVEEVDEFAEWVKDVRQKAKQPKNKDLRDFLEKRYSRHR